MQMWVNWRTRITHLTRDCHQIARLTDDIAWLEMQEGTAEELTETGRRYCSWCVQRLILAADAANVVPGADLHPPAERADFIGTGKVRPRQ